MYVWTVKGLYCEHHTTYCILEGNDACLNGATCENQNDGYICHCAPGFTGQFCFSTLYIEFHCS